MQQIKVANFVYGLNLKAKDLGNIAPKDNESLSEDDNEGWVFRGRGRGILQLTGEEDSSGFYNLAGPYAQYANKVKNIEIIKNPDIVSNTLHYAVDSGGWEWSCFKKRPAWNITGKHAKENEWKREYFDLAKHGDSLNDMALYANYDDKYFFLVSKLLNGYPPSHTTETPIGWDKRKNAYIKLKKWFDFDHCINHKK